METGLRLLHPMMPFITEELYQKLGNFESKCETISLATYPSFESQNEFADSEKFDNVLNTLAKTRSMMASVNLPPKTAPNVYLSKEGDLDTKYFEPYIHFISKMAKTGEIKWSTAEKVPEGCLVGLVNNIKISIDIKDFMKVDDEIKKIEKQLANEMKQVDKIKTKQLKPDYKTKVPIDTQNAEAAALQDWELKVKTTKSQLDFFLAMKKQKK